jgi:hypothetical protein
MARAKENKSGLVADNGHSEPSVSPVKVTRGSFIQVGTSAAVDFTPVSPNSKSGTVDIDPKGPKGK